MKIINIYINKNGEVVVEHDRTLTHMEIFNALARATNIVYQSIMEEEARKRAIEVSDMERIARVMAQSK